MIVFELTLLLCFVLSNEAKKERGGAAIQNEALFCVDRDTQNCLAYGVILNKALDLPNKSLFIVACLHKPPRTLNEGFSKDRHFNTHVKSLLLMFQLAFWQFQWPCDKLLCMDFYCLTKNSYLEIEPLVCFSA